MNIRALWSIQRDKGHICFVLGYTFVLADLLRRNARGRDSSVGIATRYGLEGARCWWRSWFRGTALQAGRSRVRFAMVLLSFRPRYGPRVDSASNRIFPGGKGGRCVGLTTLPPPCADCHETQEPQPPGALRASRSLHRIAVPLLSCLLLGSSIST